MICADARRPGACARRARRCRHGGDNDMGRGTRRARLGVGRLGLLDSFVVLIPRRDLARQVVVDARQSLGQDPQVVLDLGCSGTGALAAAHACATAPSTHAGTCKQPCYPTFLLLIARDRLVQLLALAPQLLDALPTSGARARLRRDASWRHRFERRRKSSPGPARCCSFAAWRPAWSCLSQGLMQQQERPSFQAGWLGEVMCPEG